MKVVLPLLTLSATPNKPTAQAGDTITYTLVLTNAAANGSAADAYDVNLTNLLPADLTYVPGSITNTAGTVPTTLTDSGGTPVVTYSDLALNGSSTLTFQATVDSTTGPYQTLTDTATAAYTTLPGPVTTPQSSYNAVSTERTGNTSDPGGAVNNLDASGSAPISTILPAVSKVLLGTNLATTTGTNVAIGEQVQYQVTITVPDGVTQNAVLTDTLPPAWRSSASTASPNRPASARRRRAGSAASSRRRPWAATAGPCR